MGQTTPKMCHTQEIAFEPTHDEWRPVDEWSEDITEGQQCNPPPHCRFCCRPNDSTVEEVLVVHHEALQKVDFLLRHDELTSCESPAVPECVTAVRRAKILKRLLSQQRTRGATAQDLIGSSPSCMRDASGLRQPPQPMHDDGDDGDPSDEDLRDETDMLLIGEFSGDGRQTSSIEHRLRKGLEMWILMRGRDEQILQEAVLLQVPESDTQVVRITNEHRRVQLALANVRCIELTTTAGSTHQEPNTYVYLTATLDSQKAGEAAHHFAFQSAQDAHDFQNWMRARFPRQVVAESDANPLSGVF